MMYVLSRGENGESSGWCGDFTEDLDFAVDAATSSFSVLLGRKTSSPIATLRDKIRRSKNQLPRKLRHG